MKTQGEFQVLTPEHITTSDLALSPMQQKSEPVAISPTAPTPITPDMMIQKLYADGNVDALAKFMDLKLRWDAAENKRKFDAALESFRKNKLVIEKTKLVSFPTSGGGQTSYWHAELDKASEIINDALMAVGLSYTWEPDSTPDGKPKMSLIMRGFGHTERLGGLVGPPDASGGKNAMQAVGSSTTYLARYVLLLSLGIVPEGKDDDGRMATGGMSDTAIDEYCQTIKDGSNLEESKAAFGRAWNAANGDQPARNRFKAVWEAKKKAMQEAKRG